MQLPSPPYLRPVQILIGRWMLFKRTELDGSKPHLYPAVCDILRIHADGTVKQALHSGIPNDATPWRIQPDLQYTEEGPDMFLNNPTGKEYRIINVNQHQLILAPCDKWGKPQRHFYFKRLPDKN